MRKGRKTSLEMGRSQTLKLARLRQSGRTHQSGQTGFEKPPRVDQSRENLQEVGGQDDGGDGWSVCDPGGRCGCPMGW